MSEKKIRRCGNCGYAANVETTVGFLTLRCISFRSKYPGAVRNAGYFGCSSHTRVIPGTRRE